MKSLTHRAGHVRARIEFIIQVSREAAAGIWDGDGDMGWVGGTAMWMKEGTGAGFGVGGLAMVIWMCIGIGDGDGDGDGNSDREKGKT